MMNLAEYRNRNSRLADFLPWVALVGARRRAQQGRQLPAHRALSRSRSRQRHAGRTGRRRRPAQQRLPPPRLRLGDLRRGAAPSGATAIPTACFPDPASALVDAERKAEFEEAGAHFESSYFLTFALAAAGRGRRARRNWLYEGREQTGVDPTEALKRLRRSHRPHAAAGRRLHARMPLAR
jgi:hypothetical protein